MYIIRERDMKFESSKYHGNVISLHKNRWR